MYELDALKVSETINSLSGYCGFIQYSNRAEHEVFPTPQESVSIEPGEGFIIEAHFFNPKTNHSIAIRHCNSHWLKDEEKLDDLSSDSEYYLTKIKNIKIRMKQVWREVKDPRCENMAVLKLQKVMFAGFKEKKDDNSAV